MNLSSQVDPAMSMQAVQELPADVNPPFDPLAKTMGSPGSDRYTIIVLFKHN